jgi:glutamate 5-kinase
LKQSVKSYKRIVVKIGSSLMQKDLKLDFSYLEEIVNLIAKVSGEGKEIILVSSGAIALRVKRKAKEISIPTGSGSSGAK